MKKDILDNRQLERAAFYAMGAFDQSEEEEFHTWVQASAARQAEVESFYPALEALGDLAPQVEPPAALRQRLLAAIATTATPPSAPETSIITVKSATLPWKSMGFPGVSFKHLNLDLELGRITMLVKLEAGSVFPPHHHLQREENLVLEGDLIGESYRLGPGDYMLGHEGSHHAAFTSDQGCVVLVMAALSERVLDLINS